MLRALDEYRDLLISEPTPPALDLPRSHISLGRLGKRVHEFISMREPLVDDQPHHHDDPRHNTTSMTSVGATSFSHTSAPIQSDFLGFGSLFIPSTQFIDIGGADPSSYILHVGPQSSSYDLNLSFFGTLP